MCGRFFLDSEAIALLPSFGVWLQGPITPSRNICPGTAITTVVAKDASFTTHEQRWGYRPGWENGPRELINLRSEGIFEKRFARNAILRQRCIVPASGFYEWKERGKGVKKTPYAFTSNETPLIGIAGVSFTTTADEHECALLTTTPNDVVATVHKRMPVLISPTEWRTWLDPHTTEETIRTFFSPYSPQKTTSVETVIS